MKSKESFNPGDEVEVESCDKNPDSCIVSDAITRREDEAVPLVGYACGCVRSPHEVKPKENSSK